MSAYLSRPQHEAARAIECPICRVAAGAPCTGIETPHAGHFARVHLHAVAHKPMPDAACIAAMTEVVGQRAEARPFVAWLDGQHEFRTASARSIGTLAMRVFQLGAQDAVATVRRATLDVALRFGLVISSSEGGRGRWAVTQRGIDLHQRLLAPRAAS